jgi:hypothetical protein
MIIPFKGKVKYPITLDPGVWIFDDRKLDLNTYFESEKPVVDENEEYTKKVGKIFDREIKEGAVLPPTLKSERRFLKERLLTGTFGIKLEPFLKNAEPTEDANSLIIETKNGDVSIPIETAGTLVLAFSKDGKPLKEDGPIHVLYEDGSNRENPIKYVTAFRLG